MNTDQLLAHYEQVADAPDAITRLRRFILDLAVRGKLVSQDPYDEPVSELLKRIATTKARLMKAGSIRKLRGSRNIDAVFETEPSFDTPKSWRWVMLPDIIHFSAGRTPARNNEIYWQSSDYHWVSIADMVNGKTLTHTKESVSEHAKSSVFRADPKPPGTIIMSFKLTIGKIARLGVPAYHNEAIISVDPYVSDIDPYIFKILPIFAQRANSKNAIKGSTLNQQSIATILIPLPPLAEQHRIVAKVDELMALCDQLDVEREKRETTRDRLAVASLARLNTSDPATFREHATFTLDNLYSFTTRSDQIQALRQTILDLAVRGKLVPQDPNGEPASELLKRIAVEKVRLVKKKKIKVRRASKPAICSEVPFNLPPRWSPAKIEQILVEIQTGPFGSTLHQSDYQLGGTPVINPASIQNGRIVPIDKMAVGPVTLERLASFKLQTGDIIMGRRGEMGRCAVVSKLERGWLCGTGSLILRPSEYLYPHFLAMLISSPFSRQYLDGTAVGTTMQNLNQTILLNLSFGLPPFAEQHRIVAKVNELMELCDLLEASLAIGDNTRCRLLDALLHEALEPDANRPKVVSQG